MTAQVFAAQVVRLDVTGAGFQRMTQVHSSSSFFSLLSLQLNQLHRVIQIDDPRHQKPFWNRVVFVLSKIMVPKLFWPVLFFFCCRPTDLMWPS